MLLFIFKVLLIVLAAIFILLAFICALVLYVIHVFSEVTQNPFDYADERAENDQIFRQ